MTNLSKLEVLGEKDKDFSFMSLEETEEEETVALVLVQIWGLRHVPDHEWGLASGLRALSMIATAGMAIAVSLWLPHSRCKPVSPASNGHQGSYGVVLEEVTRGYVGLPQQNTPSPFCTSLTPAKHLSVICKPLFWGISCQLIWVLVQKWLPWYLSTTPPQDKCCDPNHWSLSFSNAHEAGTAPSEKNRWKNWFVEVHMREIYRTQFE